METKYLAKGRGSKSPSVLPFMKKSNPSSRCWRSVGRRWSGGCCGGSHPSTMPRASCARTAAPRARGSAGRARASRGRPCRPARGSGNGGAASHCWALGPLLARRAALWQGSGLKRSQEPNVGTWSCQLVLGLTPSFVPGTRQSTGSLRSSGAAACWSLQRVCTAEHRGPTRTGNALRPPQLRVEGRAAQAEQRACGPR